MTNITITVPADFENKDDLLRFANIVQKAVNALVKKFGKFAVKLCPKCNEAWERGDGDKQRKYGTGWPMKSKLQKVTCDTCRKGVYLE